MIPVVYSLVWYFYPVFPALQESLKHFEIVSEHSSGLMVDVLDNEMYQS